MMISEHLAADGGVVVEPLSPGARDYAVEVGVTLLVSRQQRQVELPLGVRERMRVRLKAKDRLDPGLDCSFLQPYMRTDVAMLRSRYGRDLQLNRALHVLDRSPEAIHVAERRVVM